MTEQFKGSVSSLIEESKLYPQEKVARLKRNQAQLKIGVPKENSTYENRIPLTPKAVETLTAQGHQVLVQAGMGEPSNFSDEEYTKAGANLSADPEEVFKSDVVIKVEFPTVEEIEWMNSGQTIISATHARGKDIRSRLDLINQKRLIAVGYEFIEDKVGGLPIVRAMSEIAGVSVMPIAAEYLSKENDGAGIILGGITGVPPTNVVIIGAGTVTEYAARTALGMGASVKIFDQHIYKLHRLKHILSASVFTSTVDPVAFKKALSEADVVIGAIRAEKGVMKKILSEEMVMSMKKGAVILDVSIDEGGCVETSIPTNLKNPSFIRHGVVHYCVPNIASKYPRTSSKALSNIFTPILTSISNTGGVDQMIFEHIWFMKGVYAYKGFITNYHLAHKHSLRYKDLNLLMAARF